MTRITALATFAAVLFGAGTAHALGTPCDACWANNQGCSSYFLLSCNTTQTYAYYKSKSTTQWLSKCSDGTYYLNTDCKNTITVGGTTFTNVCKVPCVRPQ